MPYPHIPGIQFDIETTCEKCFYNPTAHSFHKMSENESEVYFYTCHARSKYYDDSEGFAKHMKLEIEKIKNKEIEHRKIHLNQKRVTTLQSC